MKQEQISVIYKAICKTQVYNFLIVKYIHWQQSSQKFTRFAWHSFIFCSFGKSSTFDTNLHCNESQTRVTGFIHSKQNLHCDLA